MKKKLIKNKNVNKIPRNVIKTGDFKYLDTVLSADIPVTTSGAIVIPSLNIVPTGTISTTRVGKKIRVFKIEYMLQLTRGFVTNNSNSASNSRLTLVLDNATRGSGPSYTDIFEGGTFASFLNASNTNRFSVLKELLVTINNYQVFNGTTGQYVQFANTKYVKGSFSCNIPILYTSGGTTGAISQTIANCLLLTFIGDNAETALVQVGTAFRIYFTDD